MRKLTDNQYRAYAEAWLNHKEQHDTITTNSELKGFEHAFIAGLDFHQQEIERIQAELAQCQEQARLYHNAIVAMQGEVERLKEESR